MDININISVLLVAILLISCNSRIDTQFNFEEITKDDIELFTQIGINSRFVSNESKARFQWRKNDVFCDLNLENGKLSSKDCILSDNDIRKEKAERILRRFIELDCTGIVDVDGKGNIIFNKNEERYLYSNGISLNELKSKMSNLSSMNLIESKWYKLKEE